MEETLCRFLEKIGRHAYIYIYILPDRTDRNLKGLILKLSKLWKFNRWNMEKFFSIVPSDIELLMFISYSIDLFYD